MSSGARHARRGRCVGAHACGAANPPPRRRRSSVSLVRAERRDMPVVLEATGTVSALTSVDVKPQMASVVTQVHVKEGGSSCAAAICSSRSIRAATRPTSARRRRSCRRIWPRWPTRSGSLRAARALRAELHLAGRGGHQPGAGRIAAGGGGRRSRRHRRRARGPVPTRASRRPAGARRADSGGGGHGVQPGGAALVTITQLDPISVAFSLPQRNLPDALAALRGSGAPVQAQLPDGAARSPGGCSSSTTRSTRPPARCA